MILIYLADDFDSSMDDSESEGRCNVVIALMQQHRKPKRNMKIPNYQIGFFVYEVKANQGASELKLHHTKYLLYFLFSQVKHKSNAVFFYL